MIAMLVGRWTYLPRLLISGFALAGGVLVAATFIEPGTDVILQALSLDGSVIYADPGAAEGLAARIAIAALAGIMLATPVVFYQLGLAATGSKAGRWLAVRFAVVATGCFVGGVLLSHFVLFPSAWRSLRGSFRTAPSSFHDFSPRSRSMQGCCSRVDWCFKCRRWRSFLLGWGS